MAFVRTKTRNGKRRYHLVENYRENGKVRQRTIAYLADHSTVEVAIEKFTAEIQDYRQTAESYRRTAGEMRQQMNPDWLVNGEVPKPHRGPERWINAAYTRYWWKLQHADSCDYWADKRQNQLDKLQAHVRSAHEREASFSFVGTTPHVRSDHEIEACFTLVGTTPGAAA